MDTPNEFEILIRRRMPFISSFLYCTMIFLLAILLIFYIVMSPAVHSRSSSEMQVAYYIIVVPDVLKTLSSYSFIGLLVIVPLYYRARLHKTATLIIEEDRLYITGRKIEISIPFAGIKKVFCNDLKNFNDMPKEKLQVVVEQKNEITTTFQLKDYEMGGELIEKLGTLEGVALGGYDREMLTEYDE